MNFSRFGIFGLVVLTLAVAAQRRRARTRPSAGFAELRKAAMSVRHTQDAENRIEHIYRRVVDAETGQRGYLLTLDPTYLQPYVEARRDVPRELDELGLAHAGQSGAGRADLPRSGSCSTPDSRNWTSRWL